MMRVFEYAYRNFKKYYIKGLLLVVTVCMQNYFYEAYSLKNELREFEKRLTAMETSRVKMELNDEDSDYDEKTEPSIEETETVTEYVPPKRNCKPKNQVAFAKTHKTGSSTVQNILLRYGDERNLTFAVPEKSWMFSFQEPFTSETVLELPWAVNGYDFFAFHCIWNYEEVHKVIPKAFFTTILRDPIDCYESNYVYMGLQNAFKMDINEYAKKKAIHDPPRRKKVIIGKNQMLWDLGVTIDQMDNIDVVNQKINEFDKQFKFVMLAEYFDESLVILADKLCWDLKDVRYLKQNARVAEKKSVIKPETRSIMTNWLRSDYMLYSFFKTRFQEEVEKYGKERLARDTARLRQLNEQLKKDCVLEVADNSKLEGDFKMAIDIVEGYVINQDKPWCFPYATTEPKYSVHVRKQAQLRAGLIGKKPLIKNTR